MGNSRVPVPEIPPEVRQATLSAYLEYVYTSKLCFKRESAEVQHIKEAVIELVNKVMHEVGEIDPRFIIRKPIFVGSMMERTKNGEPNEFDFLVVVDSLSLSDGLTLSRECEDKKGYIHIHMRQDANPTLKELWKSLIQNEQVQSTESGFGFFKKSGFRDLFLKAIQSALKNVKKMKSHGIEKSTGKLVIQSSDVEKHGPACLCLFEWQPRSNSSHQKQNLLISVDVTPTIQFADVCSTISNDEVEDELLYSRLRDSNVFMCISCGKTTCKDGLCFKLTFTNTEMTFMADLSTHHRKCYRILKYLFNGLDAKYVANVIFHSYSLKTFILRHHGDGSSCDESSLAKCVLEIVDSIENCLNTCDRPWYKQLFKQKFELNLPSFLLPAHNIFDKPYASDFWKANKKGIEEMRKSLDRVSKLELPEDTEEWNGTFKRYEIAIVNRYVPQGPPPPNFQLPYHRMGSRNMMMLRSMNTMHMHSMHMTRMHSLRH